MMVQMYPSLVDDTRRYLHVLGAMVDDGDSVCKHGFLKKVKTNKHKYFVLHSESTSAPARLEYYAKKSYWEKKRNPRKTIYLKTCFSINAFSDSKTQWGMMLYFKDDSFQIGFESEESRDSWLMAVMALNSAHSDAARPMFPHVWDVKIADRDIGKKLEGDAYRLCLNDRQVILVKKSCLDPSVYFPLEVIRRCGHVSCFFNLEVGRQAMTGSGEIWMEVEDSLIAENVHQAIQANMNKSKMVEDFRGRSKSSGKISKRSQSPSVMSPSNGSQQIAGHRDRTDSIDSRCTNQSSLSIEECDQMIRAMTPDPRPASPYLSMSGSQSASISSVSSVSNDPVSDDSYMPMLPGSYSSQSRLAAHPHDSQLTDSYMEMNPSSTQSGKISTSAYMDMAPASHASNDTTGYIDMTSNQKHLDNGSPYLEMSSRVDNNNRSNKQLLELQNEMVNHPYIDMTSGVHVMRERGDMDGRKPDHVRSYLSEDKSKMPQRHYSVGSRPHKHKKKVDNSSYVEMNRNHQLSEKEKSCSAPHLMPLSLASNPDLSHLHEDFHPAAPPSKPADTFMMMEFDRPRTASDTQGHRPRGATWSQTTRPRSSSHGQKHRPKMSKVSSRDSVKSTCSDYMDMTAKTDAYVEMHPHSKDNGRTRKGSHPFVTPQLKVSPPKLKGGRHPTKSNSFDYSDKHRITGEYDSRHSDENKENNGILMPRRQSQSRSVCEPFPELSGSSEEDVSMHSNDSNGSRMSASSSHSSLHRGDDSRRYNPAGYGLDSEVYVDCQPATVMHSRTSSLSHMTGKPTRVASFISDDTVPKKSASPPQTRSQSPLAAAPQLPKAQDLPVHKSLPANSDYMDMPGSGKFTVSDNKDLPAGSDYVEMPGSASKPASHAVNATVKQTTDSYMEMQPGPQTRDMSMYKPLPKITMPPVPSASTASTVATSVSDSRSTAATGSSGESNSTVVDDSYSLMDYQQQISPTAPKSSFTTHSVTCPKPGVCYIRQDSADVIVPTPLRPMPCYIRATSSSSQLSEDRELLTAAAADNAAVMELLMSQSGQDCDRGNVLGFSNAHLVQESQQRNSMPASDAYMMMDVSTTAPVSPILIKPSLSLTVDMPPTPPRSPSYNRSKLATRQQHDSISEQVNEADIPSSAAELHEQLQQQRSILERLTEECEETTTVPSTPAPVNVPCYIKDNNKRTKRQTSSSSKTSGSESSHPPLDKATSYILQDDKTEGDVFPDSPQKQEKPRNPPPSLPPRQAPEKPSKRPTTAEQGELIYVDLDLNTPPVSGATTSMVSPTSPKPRTGATDEGDTEKPTEYTEIDHKQTEQLQKALKSDKI